MRQIYTREDAEKMLALPPEYIFLISLGRYGLVVNSEREEELAKELRSLIDSEIQQALAATAARPAEVSEHHDPVVEEKETSSPSGESPETTFGKLSRIARAFLNNEQKPALTPEKEK